MLLYLYILFIVIILILLNGNIQIKREYNSLYITFIDSLDRKKYWTPQEYLKNLSLYKFMIYPLGNDKNVYKSLIFL